jgi:hypothetical protein
MTGHEILNAVLSDQRVFIHYTDEHGLQGMLHEGVIRTNFKGVVYLTQEPMSEGDAHTRLFIGASTHAGRGSHLILLRVDLGLPVTRLTDYEFSVSQSIKLHQHTVMYSGPNPM